MSAALHLAGPLADKSGEAAKAGPIGLVVIVVLCIVCYFLFKSMSKHLKKVREDFPAGADGPEPTAHVADAADRVAPAPAPAPAQAADDAAEDNPHT